MGNGALPSGSTGNASGSGSLVWGIPGKVAMVQTTTPARAGIGGKRLAEWTGLEPATPGVTGRYSNQLNYHSSIF